MSNLNFQTPLLVLVYNRVFETKLLFNSLKKLKPVNLYIHADGYKDSEIDKEKCMRVRKIFEKIDWKCNIKFFFEDSNVGCTKSSIKALNWIFSYEDKAIILEDDCIPSFSFYKFSSDLLDYYYNDTRIMGISGSYISNTKAGPNSSYHFSRLADTWGFATWKRSWLLVNKNFSAMDEFLNSEYFNSIFRKKSSINYWRDKFFNVKNVNLTHGWDYLWTYTVMANYGLYIYPNVNMIKNIGFNGGVHKQSKSSPFLNNSLYNIKFPIKHPKIIAPEIKIDNYVTEHHVKEFYNFHAKLKSFVINNIPASIYSFLKKK